MRNIWEIVEKEEQNEVIEKVLGREPGSVDWETAIKELEGYILVWFENEIGNWKLIDAFYLYDGDELEGLAARIRENSNYHITFFGN